MGEKWFFRLLGPLEVRHDDTLIPITAAKQRALVTVLALSPGQPVPTERLILCLWGDRPPSTARNTLQNYVLRLRRLLQPDTEPSPVRSSAAGYQLAVPAEAVDAHRFTALLRQARAASTTPATAAALLDEALGLWRGEALADVPSETLHRDVVPGLIEEHLDAQEQRVDVGLRLGRHAELVTELVALTAQHPLRERMWAQLMLALYRSGRGAEALDAYQQASKLLAEELGIDAGPELRRLHQAMLTNDAALTVTDAPRQAPTREQILPRQLPAPAAQFVGRDEELRHLSDQLDAAQDARATVISAIGGTAGIGKTTLAVRWGHQHAERFPGGQLYVNLCGFDPVSEPLPPATAVRGFLTALGVTAGQIPTDPDEQVALYRTKMAQRRMLLVLDNARDAHQVRPLLPGSAGCVVLVTSRNQLTSLIALDGAVPVTLDLLSSTEARNLLADRIGTQRVEREREVVDELVEACARLPLALTITAAHAALHPTRPLATLADELRDAQHRLDALSAGDPAADVRAVFSWSYRTLSPTAARVFRLLGLHPGADIDLPAVASLTALEPAEARNGVEELVGAHLITECAPGRYCMHDLLRAYAAEESQQHDTDAERLDALRRALDFYLHTAHAADRLLDEHRELVALDPITPGTRPQPLPDAAAAMAWFDAEHANLQAMQEVALARDWHLAVYQIPWKLGKFHARQGYGHERLAMWTAALRASEHLSDPRCRIHSHRHLGRANVDLSRHEEGIVHLKQALELARESDDLFQQGHVLQLLAVAWELRGDSRQALTHATQALELFRSLGDPLQEANALSKMGWCAARVAEYDAAREHCNASLALYRSMDIPEGAACVLDSLGYIHQNDGCPAEAIEYYEQALALFRELGDTYECANSLENLGNSHATLGAWGAARTAWQEALDIYRRQARDTDATRVESRLTEIPQ